MEDKLLQHGLKGGISDLLGEEELLPQVHQGGLISGFLAQTAKIDVSDIVASTGLGHGSTVPG